MIASDSCAELRSPIGLGPAADSDRLRTVATAGLIRAAGFDHIKHDFVQSRQADRPKIPTILRLTLRFALPAESSRASSKSSDEGRLPGD
jgi:hypothetical protein